MTQADVDARPTKSGLRRIMLITRNFPPLVGGMERYNQRVFEQLSRSFASVLCGPEGCERAVAPGIPVRTAPIRPLTLFLARMFCTSLAIARRSRPDVIFAGSGLTAPIAWAVGRVFRKPVLVFLYGLDLVVASRLYQALWIPILRRCDGFLVISAYTRQLAVAKGLRTDRMHMIHPGVDMPADVIAAPDFRLRHGLGNRRILISVGRLTRRKGLVEFIRESLPAIVHSCPDTVLVVVGGEPVDALAGNRGGVTDEATRVARELGLEANVRFLGSVDDAEVHAAYHDACVHVFPIRDIPGDIEGFGIVALEAASHGVPTVAFAVGGVPDAVGEGVSGRLVAPGDYNAMSEALIGYIDARDNAASHAACVEFAKSFAWDRIGARLTKVVDEFV